MNEFISTALLCQVLDHSEVVRNLCVNVYRCRDSLSDCKPDKDMYHVFTRSDWEQRMFWNILTTYFAVTHRSLLLRVSWVVFWKKLMKFMN